MLEVNGKRLRFARTLWVQYGGVKARDAQDAVTVEGVDGESYLKVFNTFGRVLKLFTFEEGRWIDTDTGAEAAGLDESLAGHVAPAPAQTAPAAGGAGVKKNASRKPAAAAAKPKGKAAPATKAKGKAAPATKAKGKAAPATKAKGKATATAKPRRPAARAAAGKGGAATGKAAAGAKPARSPLKGGAAKGKAASPARGKAKGKAASPGRGKAKGKAASPGRGKAK